jgi:hypothetical protein
VFAEVLDTPAPPLASAETVLAAARRRARHRRWAWGATGSTAALALAATAALVLSIADVPAGRGPQTAPQDLAAGSPTLEPSPSPTTEPPARKGITLPNGTQYTVGPEIERARALLAELFRAVPAGYTTPDTDTIDATLAGQPLRVQVKGVQVIEWTGKGIEYTFLHRRLPRRPGRHALGEGAHRLGRSVARQ